MIEVALYGLLAVGLPVDDPGPDPYDPEAIDVAVEVSARGGPGRAWPAFWDGAAWRWRYQPTVVGPHAVTVRVDGAAVDTWSFTATPSTAPGPVHADGWGLRHADGASFVPLGVNLGWSAGGGPDDYAAWFGELAEHGGNAARVWITHFTGQNPTWDTLGDMDPQAAEAVDAILDAADAHGIRVVLVLWQHSQLEALAWSAWESNPYNAANGGPCDDSRCFFVDPEAIAYQERFSRYAVARWGAHPALLGWEVMNEIDAVSGVDSATVSAWAADRAASLRALDDRHPVTWSTAIAPSPGAEALWAGTDIVQLHHYQGTDLDLLLEALDAGVQAGAGPVLLGEWGLDWFGHADREDTEGLAWHNANWAALSGGAAGNAWSWWWDEHIAPDDLWWRLEGLAAITAGLDLPAMGPAPVEATPSRLLARGRSDGERALVWVHDPAHTHPDPQGSAIEAATVVVPGLPDAAWIARDTVTGAVLAEGRVCGEPVPLPAFRGDLALILEDEAARCARSCAHGPGTAPGGPALAPLALSLLVGRARRDG